VSLKIRVVSTLSNGQKIGVDNIGMGWGMNQLTLILGNQGTLWSDWVNSDII
jgi:hypothetical protein